MGNLCRVAQPTVFFGDVLCEKSLCGHAVGLAEQTEHEMFRAQRITR